MKKLFLLLLGVVLALAVRAQITVTISPTDNLEAVLTNAVGANYSSVTDLVINGGPLKVEDFEFIRDSMAITLQTIDMSNATIVDNSIPNDAFYGCTGITSIIIPPSVTSIGYYAFGKTGITSITIPASVISISYSVFEYCENLVTITVNGSNLNYLSDNGVLFNYEGSELIQYPPGKIGLYSIPTSVTSIAYKAFYSCPAITSVTIPSMVTTIGVDAFTHCPNLISIDVNTSNPNYSSTDGVLFDKFSTKLIQCPGGKSGAYTTMPSTVTTIGESAFAECWNITSIIIPPSVTSIEDYAFSKTGLTSVTIPASVTSIGEQAFFNCLDLLTVSISNTVKSIGTLAFNYCPSLTTINIPASVTNIGNSIFEGCAGLTTIRAEGIQPVDLSGSASVFQSVDKGTCILYVPAGSTDAYREANQWSEFTNIQETMEEIYIATTLKAAIDLTTKPYSSITGIKIMGGTMNPVDFEFIRTNMKNTLKVMDMSAATIAGNSIPTHAFIDCTGLTSVTIPSSVTSIGYQSFQGSGLTAITIPASVTSIESRAFEGCGNLTAIYAYPVQPVSLSGSPGVFTGINTGTCTLYVPFGTKSAYQAADLWKDFTNIREMDAYSVVFDTQAGDAMNVMVPMETPVSEPEEPTRAGYTFGGWYREAACINAWDFDTPVTSDITLYARWTLVQSVIAGNIYQHLVDDDDDDDDDPNPVESGYVKTYLAADGHLKQVDSVGFTAGTFTTGLLPFGKYVVSIHAEGYITGYYNALPGIAAHSHWGQADTISIVSVEPKPYTVYLQKRPVLSGTFRITGYANKDKEQPGPQSIAVNGLQSPGTVHVKMPGTKSTMARPVSNTTVVLHGKNPVTSGQEKDNNGEYPYLVDEIVPDSEDGHYEFNNLPRNEYLVTIDIPGVEMGTPQVVNIPADAEEGTSFDNIDFAIDEANNIINAQVTEDPEPTNSIVPGIANRVKVYPNPVIDQVRISIGREGTYTMRIYNVLGKLITSAVSTLPEYILDMSNYPAGVYFMRIDADGQTTTIKLIRN